MTLSLSHTSTVSFDLGLGVSALSHPSIHSDTTRTFSDTLYLGSSSGEKRESLCSPFYLILKQGKDSLRLKLRLIAQTRSDPKSDRHIFSSITVIGIVQALCL